MAVRDNQALGASFRGGAAYGGGICVNQGDLTLLNSTVSNNQAIGVATARWAMDPWLLAGFRREATPTGAASISTVGN